MAGTTPTVDRLELEATLRRNDPVYGWGRTYPPAVRGWDGRGNGPRAKRKVAAKPAFLPPKEWKPDSDTAETE